MKLGEIAQRLSCELEGDPDLEITGVATLEEAGEGQISFLANIKYTQEARATRASAVIAAPNCPPLAAALLKHTNPYLIFAKAIDIFYPQQTGKRFIHPSAFVADSARIGRQVTIGPFVSIGEEVVIEDNVTVESNAVIGDNSRIGSGTLIRAGAVIREKVTVGRRCIVHNNVVIGSDGFGYAKQDDGSWYKIYQAGQVIIGDDVEIGAGSTIDRATIGETRVKDGAKLDNLVQVGHGCVVGEHTLLCSQVGLAGSTVIGKGVILAGQVGSAGHLTVGDGAVVTAKSGIPRDVEPGKVISGIPAFENKQWLKSTAIIARLPEILKSIRQMEIRIKDLENTLKVTHDRQENGA